MLSLFVVSIPANPVLIKYSGTVMAESVLSPATVVPVLALLVAAIVIPGNTSPEISTAIVDSYEPLA